MKTRYEEDNSNSQSLLPKKPVLLKILITSVKYLQAFDLGHIKKDTVWTWRISLEPRDQAHKKSSFIKSIWPPQPNTEDWEYAIYMVTTMRVN